MKSTIKMASQTPQIPNPNFPDFPQISIGNHLQYVPRKRTAHEHRQTDKTCRSFCQAYLSLPLSRAFVPSSLFLCLDLAVLDKSGKILVKYGFGVWWEVWGGILNVNLKL